MCFIYVFGILTSLLYANCDGASDGVADSEIIVFLNKMDGTDLNAVRIDQDATVEALWREARLLFDRSGKNSRRKFHLSAHGKLLKVLGETSKQVPYYQTLAEAGIAWNDVVDVRVINPWFWVTLTHRGDPRRSSMQIYPDNVSTFETFIQLILEHYNLKSGRKCAKIVPSPGTTWDRPDGLLDRLSEWGLEFPFVEQNVLKLNWPSEGEPSSYKEYWLDIERVRP